MLCLAAKYSQAENFSGRKIGMSEEGEGRWEDDIDDSDGSWEDFSSDEKEEVIDQYEGEDFVIPEATQPPPNSRAQHFYTSANMHTSNSPASCSLSNTFQAGSFSEAHLRLATAYLSTGAEDGSEVRRLLVCCFFFLSCVWRKCGVGRLGPARGSQV